MTQLIIFDMAGTAINEDNLVYKTILSTLLDFGVETNLASVLAWGAGKEKKTAIRDIISATRKDPVTEEMIDKIHEKFKSRLDDAYAAAPISVFPSVQKVMVLLKEKQLKIAFNTGYSRTVAKGILEKVNIAIGTDIDVLITASDVARNRPHPDMILSICEILNIPPACCIKIGDSAIDITEGKNAGVQYTVGITTGAQTRAQMEVAQPDFIIDDMLELLLILEGGQGIT